MDSKSSLTASGIYPFIPMTWAVSLSLNFALFEDGPSEFSSINNSFPYKA